MSWLDPPPLVRKRTPAEVLQLPSAIKTERVQRLVLVTMIVCGFLGTMLTFLVITLITFYADIPRSFQGGLTVAGGLFTACLGGVLALRAVCLAAAYGRALESRR